MAIWERTLPSVSSVSSSSRATKRWPPEKASAETSSPASILRPVRSGRRGALARGFVFVDVAVRFGDPEVARRVDRERGEFVARFRASVPRGSGPPGRTPRPSRRPCRRGRRRRRSRDRGAVVDGDVVVVGAEVEGAGGAFAAARALPGSFAVGVEPQHLVVAGVDHVERRRDRRRRSPSVRVRSAARPGGRSAASIAADAPRPPPPASGRR